MKTYSVKEIADMLNTNPETVRRWIRSGKLEAIQESRKNGNIITADMLESFLKNSPKYAEIAAHLVAKPGEPTTVATTLVGRVFVQQLIKNEHIRNEQVQPEEIKKLLLSNISTSKETIKNRKKTIKNLKAEILIEQQYIAEMMELIKELDLQINKR